MEQGESQSESVQRKELLQKRKDIFFKLLKKKEVIAYILLAVIIILGVHIRAQPLESFKDTTTGEYISMELDSELYLRYAEYINEHGELYDVDKMRNHPLGGGLTYLGLFTAYFVAYLYKFLHVFIPSITIGYTDIIYPLIATVVTTLFLFLLLRKIFNWKVGLLAALLLNICPPFLFRSLSSDHDILIMMFSIMSFYLYVKATEQKTIQKGMLFGGLAGAATFFGAWTGGAAYIVLAVLGIYTLLELFFNKLKKIHYYAYFSWIITFSLLLQISGIYGGLKNFLTMIITFPAFFAFIVLCVELILFKIDWGAKGMRKIEEIKTRLKTKLPEGITCIIIGFILVLILVFIFFNYNLISSLINQLIHEIVNVSRMTSDIESRWASTVAENKRPYVLDFFNQFGAIYMLAVLAGAIALFYKLVKPIKKYTIKLTIGFALFLLLFFFARSSPNFILNGDNFISKVLFFGSAIVFSIYIIYTYFIIFKEKHEYENIKNLNGNYIIILIWFLIMIVGALTAIRFSFEFAPITNVLFAFCFVEAFDYLRKIKENWIKVTGIVLIALILFSPFSFANGIVVKYYEQTNSQAKYSSLGYNTQWQVAGKWARENTPKDAVFAHWWDYGYWVQKGFKRTTITDGGNFIAWWNYLMGRHVLTAQTLEEPLKFLYAHNATHLLIINDEVGKYGAFSIIGSNESYDRFSSIPALGQDPQSQETRTETLYLYRGGFSLDEDLIYNNEIFPAGAAGIAGVILPIKESSSNETKAELQIGQPVAAVIYQGKRVDIPIKCLFYKNKKMFDNGLDACFMLVPAVEGNKMNPIGGAYYLSRKVKDGLFTRLYLFDEVNPYFKKVYTDESNVPIMIYNNRMVGPIKIWEINYPKLTLTPEEYNCYLRMDYPTLQEYYKCN